MTFFLIILISLIFWSLYHRWDTGRQEYIDHSVRTIFYFILSSSSLIIIYPEVWQLFDPTFWSVIFFVFVMWLTNTSYKVLRHIFKGPELTMHEDHMYWKLMDKRYILPKLFEILFQQTFFGSIYMIAKNAGGYISMKFILIAALAFIFAHVPLFFLRGKKYATFYLIWSIVGAPLFAIVLASTNSLWYTVSIHMLFYTLLSSFSWMKTRPKII